MSSSKEFSITLRNRGNEVVAGRRDQTIIDSTEVAGHVLPIACRYGGCITCAAKLVSGRVVQPNATALNRRQHKDGYILLCVAHPKTDVVIDVGVETHSTLYANPFRKAENLAVPGVSRPEAARTIDQADLLSTPGKK